jgi:hypothetical protein
MLDFTALAASTTDEETVVDSATALLDSLFAEVEALKGDPVALQAFVDRGRAASAKLAASVAANTAAAAEAKKHKK